MVITRALWSCSFCQRIRKPCLWGWYLHCLAGRQLSSPGSHLDAAASAAQSKSSEDIIKFSKFPAAQAPDPSEIPKIETDHWPGPPSLAAIGTHLMQLSGARGARAAQMKYLKTGEKMCPVVTLKNRGPRGRTVKRTNVVMACVCVQCFRITKPYGRRAWL